MQTITTKFLPATNTKGKRIKASTTSGISITWDWDYSWGVEENHRAAAESLKIQLGWNSTFVGGDTNNGMVFVAVDGRHKI